MMRLTASHGTLGVAGDSDVSRRARTSPADAQRASLAVYRPSTSSLVYVPCSVTHTTSLLTN